MEGDREKVAPKRVFDREGKYYGLAVSLSLCGTRKGEKISVVIVIICVEEVPDSSHLTSLVAITDGD